MIEFDDIVELYKDRIFRMLFMKVGNMEDALDLTQDVFFKVYKALRNFRNESSIYTWIYKIALNTANTFLKKNGRMNQNYIDEVGETNLTTNKQSEEELKHILRAKIDELPQHYRDVILLHYFEGFDYNEIAEILDINIGTVKSRLFRARQMLSDKMRRYL